MGATIVLANQDKECALLYPSNGFPNPGDIKM
jgi:hypothetical protein